jgi:hypothetical protein
MRNKKKEEEKLQALSENKKEKGFCCVSLLILHHQFAALNSVLLIHVTTSPVRRWKWIILSISLKAHRIC